MSRAAPRPIQLTPVSVAIRCQVLNTDDADDIKNLDLSQIHYLSGPIAVKGAKPGDALVVDIL